MEAQNLKGTYNAPLEFNEVDFSSDWALPRSKTQSIKQECSSGLDLLRKIRLDQERRDKLLKAKLDSTYRKRRWEELDSKVNSDLIFVKVSFLIFKHKIII